MISDIRYNGFSDLIVRQVPAFAVSLAVAEFFFKFGSFTLECLAFLALWYVIDFAYKKLIGDKT